MSHKFGKPIFEEGKKSVTQTCARCGNKRIAYRSGAFGYISAEGTVTPFGTKCTGGFIPEPAKAEVTKVTTDVVAETMELFKKYEKPTPTPVERPSQFFNTDEARLKELCVLVQAMYEDMVAHNVRTNSRNMAGRLLYSTGHGELVKHINSKAL